MQTSTEIENLPGPTTGKAAPKKTRGKPSSSRRLETFLDRKNADFANNRRAKIMDSMDDALLLAYDAYASQAQQGSETRTEVPFTTRGIGFHCQQLVKEAQQHLPRVELPTRADEHELYRYSLMQLARQMSICEPGPTHTRADAIPIREKVSAFSAHQNGMQISDAINQFGNFDYKDRKYVTYVPDLKIYAESFDDVEMCDSPQYQPKSPDPSTPQKRKTEVRPTLHSMPSPYTVTIFNLRNIVTALASEATPLELRRQFIHRNPIPGAIFENDLLTNSNAIMPTDYPQYVRQRFQRDVEHCTGFFNQLAQNVPGTLGRVAMDGRGNELNLASVYTLPDAHFSLNGNEVLCDFESYCFATDSLTNITRLRAYVNLMNEAPLSQDNRGMTSRFGIRDPNSSQHSMVEYWNTLAWNTSIFRKRVA